MFNRMRETCRADVDATETANFAGEIEPTEFLQIKLEPTDDSESTTTAAAEDANKGVYGDYESGENEEHQMSEWNGTQRVVNFKRIQPTNQRTSGHQTCTEHPLNALTWGSHNRHFVNGFWNYFEQNFETDFELCAKSKQGGEHVVKVHHLVLSIFCPSLKDATNKRLRLDIDEEDLDVLVEFLYHGKIKLRDDQLESVMNAAHSLGLSVLTEILSNFVGVGESNEQLKEIKEERLTETETEVEQMSIGTNIEDNIEETVLLCDVCSFTCNNVDIFKCHKQSCEERNRNQSCLIRYELPVHQLPHDRHPSSLLESIYPPPSTSAMNASLRHIGGRPFKCHLCPSTSQKRTNLKTHLVQKHNLSREAAGDIIEINYPYFVLIQKRRELMKRITATTVVENKRVAVPGQSGGTGGTSGTGSAQAKEPLITTEHLSGRHFKCHLCPTVSKRRTNLKTHLVKKHYLPPQSAGELIERIYPYFVLMTKKRQSVKSDSTPPPPPVVKQKRLHLVEDRPFKCTMCPVACKASTNLETHLMHMHNTSLKKVREIIQKIEQKKNLTGNRNSYRTRQIEI